MNTLTKEDVIKQVRVKLDEIGLNESGMMDATSDNTNLDTVIKSCISEAYRLVAMNADVSLLEGVHGETLTLSIGENLVGRVQLPADFLRLVNARLSSWHSSYSKLISEDDPMYRMQSNQWVCATPSCPVAAIVHRSGGKVLELFKAATVDDTLSVLTYIPAYPDKEESVSISDQTVEAFIYYVAGLTMTTFKEESATDFFKIAQSLLGNE